MRHLVILAFALLSFAVYAQPENAQIETINGKKYYVYFVQSGNTLYGIHKLYNVSVEEIVAANPEVEKGLAEGQRILIPIKGSEGLPENLAIHIVEAKETLYGISKKYDVTIERLVQLNPGVENGVKEGQELKVPVKTPIGSNKQLVEKQKEFNITFSDTLIKHEVQKGETLYSISKRFMVTEKELREINELRNDRIRPGDILKIPIKKERVEKVEVREITPKEIKRKVDSTILFKRREEYNIGIMMPLFYDTEEEMPGNVPLMATEFYMGAKLALDSLEKMGLKARVYVMDSKNDTQTVKNTLAKKDVQNLDMIFGPFYGSNAGYVADWSKEKGVRMICPFATNYEILRGNPMVYQAVSSDVTLAESLAKYMFKSLGKEQVVLVKPKLEKDVALYNAFRAAYLLASNAKTKLIETTMDDFSTFIRLNDKTHLVCLSTDKGTSMAFMNAVNRNANKAGKGELIIYGTKEWITFDDISSKYKNKFNFHYASPFDLDYKNPDLQKVHKEYRKEYNADMSKMAIQGFDVVFHFCSTMLLQQSSHEGLMNDIHVSQRGEGNGFENTKCYILKYDNYEIVKVAETND